MKAVSPAAGVARGSIASLILLIAAGLGSSCSDDSAPSSEPQPNIVLISVDSLRADHLHCYGYSRPTSPTIDRLASEGALFEVVTSSSSWTLPAHAALFTALPDSAHGVDRGAKKLLAERRTLAEALQAAGYRTAGVWSGPLLDPRFGFGQGFDDYVSHAEHTEGDWDAAVERSHQEVTGRQTLDKVDALLDSDSEAPFFLFVHLWDVHYDYIPPPPYDTLFDADYSGEVDGRDLVRYLGLGLGDLSKDDLRHLEALYDGEIAWADRQIATLLEKLETLGVAEETLVVVTSDHGEELFEHGSFGHKRKLFDESIRIPLVMRYPNRIEEGRRLVQSVGIVDVAPTLLELADAEPLPDVLGRSLVPLLDGREWSRSSPLVSELVENPQTGESLLAIRSQKWKILLRPMSGGTVGLWDLKKDPHERTNIFGVDAVLTQSAITALPSTLAELERLRERHAGASLSSPGFEELPADLQRQMESLGYLNTSAPAAVQGRLRATPNPIQVCDGTGVGVTTLYWDIDGVAGPVELRVGGPDGKLFARTAAVGSATTGPWARDGMVFFLVGADGEILGSTLIRVTRAGCLGE